MENLDQETIAIIDGAQAVLDELTESEKAAEDPKEPLTKAHGWDWERFIQFAFMGGRMDKRLVEFFRTFSPTRVRELLETEQKYARLVERYNTMAVSYSQAEELLDEFDMDHQVQIHKALQWPKVEPYPDGTTPVCFCGSQNITQNPRDKNFLFCKDCYKRGWESSVACNRMCPNGHLLLAKDRPEQCPECGHPVDWYTRY